MGQVGLHGLVGLVVGRGLITAHVTDRQAKKAVMFGFVMGNLAPDLDFLAAVGMYPTDPDAAMHLHRTFSHSLLAVVTVLVGFSVLAAILADDHLKYLGRGFALGILAHLTVDIFIWFSPVDVFWPASVYGIIPPVNLWQGYEPPVVVDRLLGAAELAAYALYYQYLARAARRLGTDEEMLPMLDRMAAFCWDYWAVLSVLALDPRTPLNPIYAYIPLGVIFVPGCFYLTWRLEQTIEALAIEGYSGALD